MKHLKINYNTHHNALFFKEELDKEFQRNNVKKKLIQIVSVIPLFTEGVSFIGR